MSHLRVLVIGALAIACASGSHIPVQETGVTAKEDVFTVRLRRDARVVVQDIPAPADKVWALMPLVFKDLAFEGGPAVDQREHVFLTPELTIRQQLFTGEPNSLYLDCGKAPSGNDAANEYVVRFAVLLRVAPVTDSSSRVEVLVDGRAHDRTQSSTSLVFCTGTGRLEQSFVQQIGKRLRK